MTNGNDYAFATCTDSGLDWQVGLTKREYFAAIAMQGILAGRLEPIPAEVVVVGAVEHADALISALNLDISND